MEQIKFIVVHCSATTRGKNFTLRDIRKWHIAQGWRDVGYHYIVDLNGKVEKGREETEEGAHCYGHNKESIGVCYIGGLNASGKATDTRTDEQKAALRTLLKELKEKYPQAKIIGHNHFANKACPCFNADEEYADL